MDWSASNGTAHTRQCCISSGSGNKSDTQCDSACLGFYAPVSFSLGTFASFLMKNCQGVICLMRFIKQAAVGHLPLGTLQGPLQPAAAAQHTLAFHGELWQMAGGSAPGKAIPRFDDARCRCRFSICLQSVGLQARDGIGQLHMNILYIYTQVCMCCILEAIDMAKT